MKKVLLMIIVFMFSMNLYSKSDFDKNIAKKEKKNTQKKKEKPKIDSDMVEIFDKKITFDKYEVTNKNYNECVTAGVCNKAHYWDVSCKGYFKGKLHDDMIIKYEYTLENKPVTCINVDEAENYCKWKGKRLPTQNEWLMAFNRIKYDFSGSDFAEDVAWFDYEGYCSIFFNKDNCLPKNVGLKKANVFGVYDMSGNVWEWTSTRDEGYAIKVYYIMGGAFDTLLALAKNNISEVKHSELNSTIGFRCVKDIK